MFGFIEQVFVSAMIFFGSLSCVNPLECVSIKNQECKAGPKIVNINSNGPIFYPFSIKINKYSGYCNDISDPDARICVPDIKVFNLISLTNDAGMKVNVDVKVKN